MNQPKREVWERYPHGSSFYAYSNCPVSFRLSQAAGPEPDTDDSLLGTQVHAVLAGSLDPAKASIEVVEKANDLALQHQEALAAWSKDLEGENSDPPVIEHRIWLRQGFIPLYSGKPDRFLKVGKRVLLSDFKTGWQTLDAWPATNCQLRAYVPLVDTHYKGKIDSVTAQIHKPGKRLPPTVFGRPEINEARQWATEVANAAIDSHGEPNRGAWCKYCNGKSICPAWTKEVGTLALLSVESLSDAALAKIGPKLDLAGQVVDRLKERLFARVRDNPEGFPDWRIDPGDLRRGITDIGAAYKILQPLIGHDQFLKACRPAITELKRAIAAARSISLAKADAILSDLLEPDSVMTKSLTKPKLVYEGDNDLTKTLPD